VINVSKSNKGVSHYICVIKNALPWVFQMWVLITWCCSS